MGRARNTACCLIWDQTMVEVMKMMVASLKRSCAWTAPLSAPDPAAGHSWPTPLLETLGTLTGKSGSVSCGVPAPFSWIGVHKILFVPSKSLFPQSCVSSVIKSHCPPKSNSLGVLSPFARNPDWESCCGSLTVREFLWYNYSAVCGSSTQWRLYGGVNSDLLQKRGHMP